MKYANRVRRQAQEFEEEFEFKPREQKNMTTAGLEPATFWCRRRSKPNALPLRQVAMVGEGRLEMSHRENKSATVLDRRLHRDEPFGPSSRNIFNNDHYLLIDCLAQWLSTGRCLVLIGLPFPSQTN